MSEQQSSYRQIMKATSIFGGVQVFQIIIQIIRSKFVAVLLGPAGMGIVGLLTTTTGLIAGLTNFGIGTSAVKNIAESNATNNDIKIATTTMVLRRMVWITGTLGMLLTLILSPWLSQITFGNREYSLAFVWLSVTLLFNQLSSGELALLQGLRKLQLLAKTNLYGSFISLLIVVPIYWKFGTDGIVPGIIITSILTLVFSWYFSNKIKIYTVNLSRARTLLEGKSMLIMGFMISLSGLITLGASYIIRIFIGNYGNLVDVGLYVAGFAIIETYIGMIFTAMGADYFPRLSAVCSDKNKLRETVNQQGLIATLIIMPVIVFFVIFAPLLIQFLYSDVFLPIEKMVSIAILGTLFRAVSWSMGFVLFAKNDTILFIKTALGFNCIFLINNILGYIFLGLTGLGIAFFLNYCIHMVVLYFISKYRYQIILDHELLKIFFICLVFCSAGLSISFYLTNVNKYIIGFVLLVLALYYTFKELDKKINIKELIKKINK